jgi:uncharacterized protein
VRRDVFDSIGGYRDLPLMEDIDLVQRLKRAGRLLHSDLPVTTSARRYEQEGWARRSLRNMGLAMLYFAGAPPAALARRYCGRKAVAVAMMARAPHVSGKSRIASRVDAAGLAALRQALFHDTLDVVRGLSGADAAVVCEPPSACEEVRSQVGPGVDVLAQRPGDLGSRMCGAFADLFRLGAAGVILVGSDLPDLPPRLLEVARRALMSAGDRAVLGPAGDGGYYLVALKKPHPELFSDIDWGSGAVLEQTLEAARRSNIPVSLIDPWNDVDEWQDLERLRQARSTGAARTRGWLASLPG